MINQKQLKIQGIRFARALQIAVRTAGMLSTEHAVSSTPIQQSFNALNSLLKENREFTLGFVDNRLLVGTLLTTATGLNQLENEFLKRGISAIKFESGLSAARFKEVIAVLATPLKKIEEIGGTGPFLARTEIASVRIFPAGKAQKRTESGDTVLEMDPEAFLRAQQGAGGASGDPLAALFESAGLPKPEGIGSPGDIMSLVMPTIEAALTNQSADPGKAYVALAQVLQTVRPDAVLSAFPAARQSEVGSMSPGELAAEMIQGRAMDWAARQLAAVPAGGDAYVVEEQVVRVLARSLHATQMAEKMANRLAAYFKEYSFPPHITERVQQELAWTGLPPEEKHRQLLAIQRFNTTTFARLLEHVQDMIRKAMAEEASAVANHYLALLQAPPEQVEVEDLGRVPELVRVMSGVGGGFAQTAAEQLLGLLQRGVFEGFRHFQLLNGLAAVAQEAAIREDFEVVQNIGMAVEQCLAEDPRRHAPCCGKLLRKLVGNNAIERIVELYLDKRDDSAWTRTAAAVLRRTGTAAFEMICRRLEDEPKAALRLGLIRLMSRMGAEAVEVVRQRLADERWYVVRNACLMLGELKDPELLPQLMPVLQHSDLRVQQAAADAIIKSRAPERAEIFAAALPFLRGEVLEQVVGELLFLKDPSSLPDLERFIFSEATGRSAVLPRAVQAVAAIPGERALAVLSRVLTTASLPLPSRQAALTGLCRAGDSTAERYLADCIARLPEDDPMAQLCRRSAQAGQA